MTPDLNMNRIKVGIIGAAGYTAGELIRLLINHPKTQIVFAHSSSNAGQPFWTVHEGLFGETEQCFSADYDLTGIDVLFLCSGHGKSSAFWQDNPLPASLRVIDLAQDYRDEHDGFVYGLPEWQRDKIMNARLLANPGCFATCIQLALLPLTMNGMLHGDVNVTGITGATGSGQKPVDTTHFAWRQNNLSNYKVFTHQHLLEIERTLQHKITFVPVRGNFARGIMVDAVVDYDGSEAEVRQLYEDFYRNAAFTHVFPKAVDMKQVVNTNKCLISLEMHEGKLLITSVIDNLLKGASGQAVQNMNLMFGLDEKTGLKLKASAF